MKEWTEQALVLRVGIFREYDLWVRLLCPSHGIITAFAFGGAKSRRRFCGCLDSLNEIICHIKERKGFLNMEEAQLVFGPKRLRLDWQRHGLIANCLAFLEKLGVVSDNATEICELLRDLFKFLEEAKVVSNALPRFFRWRVANAIGLGPNLEKCNICGTQENLAFIVSEGLLQCQHCRQKRLANQIKEYYAIDLSIFALDILRQVQKTLPSTWQFNLPKQVEINCTKAIDAFIEYHLSLTDKAGQFSRI